MAPFHRILEPLHLGKISFRNRIVMSAMNTNFASADGSVTTQFIEYYAERARGGTGLIIISAAAVDRNARKRTGGLLIDDDSFIGGLRALVDRIHQYGAKVFQQINHNGRLLSSMSHGIFRIQPVAPSPVPHPITGEIPKELSRKEIEEIIGKFGDAALRVQKAGFDGVEIHGAHGYLLNQFLSLYTNKRQDAYGGDWEGRQRFPLEVVAGVREKVGSDFPISYRLSAEEYVKDGLTIEETESFAPRLEEAGVDLIHVSAGINESPLMQLKVVPMMDTPRGWLLPVSGRVKKRVNIPVIAVSRINSPEVAEQAVAERKADMIAVGRGLIADPHWVRKAAEGNSQQIRKCIACNQGCMERLIQEKQITCIYNPDVGKEQDPGVQAAISSKKVLIIGGGPGGMEAARIAALRGHHVTLWERSDRLGGQVLLYAGLPGKDEFRELIDYFIHQLEVCDIDVRLRKTATKQEVEAFRPDALILATGARPRTLHLPGIDRDRVVTFKEALTNRSDLSRDVIVVGGGLVGLETAIYLAGRDHRVTVIEMLDEVAGDAGPLTAPSLIEKMKRKGIQTLARCEFAGVDSDSLLFCQNGVERRMRSVGSIVLACGSIPEDDLANELADSNFPLERVGDCVSPRRTLEAVHEGWAAGRKI
jgi:2,4-dienoyl-CoA reductase-like NADH-dependent reductase (Old Yellow Enzyme family)/thioredoxin reductase